MESSAAAVALRVNVSERLIQPERTSSPMRTVIGTGSPLTADVSILDSPSSTTPSAAILSPGFMRRISPTSISSEGIRLNSPSISTSASSTLSPATSVIAFRLRATA